jgi:hypothetical protein
MFNISLNTRHRRTSSFVGGTIQNPNTDLTIVFYIRHLRADNTEVSLITIGTINAPDSNSPSTPDEVANPYTLLTYSSNGVSVLVGDKFYVYFTARVDGSYEQNFGAGSGRVEFDMYIQAVKATTFLNFVQKTVSPNTFNKTIFLHDAIEKCCQFYTNQVDCFKSDLLGRTERGYTADGEYGMLAITIGHWLRLRNDKKLFANLQALVELINSIACVGLGFESVDGKNILRLEKRSYFYNKTQKVLTLSNVSNIKKTLDSKRYYNSVEYGYSEKLDVGQTNAIDEFNTLRKSVIPIVNTKNKLVITTKIIGGGYQIEAQRRSAALTEDAKLDDKIFVVVLIRDGILFKTKKNEGYAEINNVFDAATGYNYDISPARNLKNWYAFIGSSLSFSVDKTIKFASGEVNYEMSTRKPNEQSVLAENGNVTPIDEPIWDNFIYSFSHPLTRDQFKLLKANPYGYVEFTDGFGHVMEGFINTGNGVDHDPNKGIAEFELLKVYRPS